MKGGEFPIPDNSCFHSQQCAEKYLKAWLQENQIPFERTHHLIPLLTACLELDDAFETLRSDLLRLENYTVGIRYPGVNATPEMAEEALQAICRVRGFVRQKLGMGHNQFDTSHFFALAENGFRAPNTGNMTLQAVLSRIWQATTAKNAPKKN